MRTPTSALRWALSVFCVAAVSMIPASLSAADARQSPSPEPAKGLSLEERADIFMARKMYREAVDIYTQITPMTPATFNRIGIAYQMQNDMASAHTYYQRAVSMRPTYAEAINNLGTLYYVQGKYRRATKLYKRAVALQPLSASMRINLAMVWLARHNDQEWERNLKIALDLDPEIFERRGGHGIVIEERSTAQRAKFNLYLARMYALRGNNELALQYIAKAMEAGFKQYKQIMDDEAFVAVRQLPQFDLLMKQPPKVL